MSETNSVLNGQWLNPGMDEPEATNAIAAGRCDPDLRQHVLASVGLEREAVEQQLRDRLDGERFLAYQAPVPEIAGKDAQAVATLLKLAAIDIDRQRHLGIDAQAGRLYVTDGAGNAAGGEITDQHPEQEAEIGDHGQRCGDNQGDHAVR